MYSEWCSVCVQVRVQHFIITSDDHDMFRSGATLLKCPFSASHLNRCLTGKSFWSNYNGSFKELNLLTKVTKSKLEKCCLMQAKKLEKSIKHYHRLNPMTQASVQHIVWSFLELLLAMKEHYYLQEIRFLESSTGRRRAYQRLPNMTKSQSQHLQAQQRRLACSCVTRTNLRKNCFQTVRWFIERETSLRSILDP